ncbi:MAG: leucine-rich repeat domain-containing protein [Promethearchaeota archaeon]|jgi:Leucine-rich repeat (LRR) protein
MKELNNKEIRWLEALAKHQDFFASFLIHYNLKQNLSSNQYYWLSLHINQAIEQGDTLISTVEVKFLKENSEKNEKLSVILSNFQENGYLDSKNYNILTKLRAEMSGTSIEVKTLESDFKHRVVKVPCPHCSFLCSPQLQFCKKCGEPLPKLDKYNELSVADNMSEISSEDYTEKNIIHSLEKLINKSIPLLEEFTRSSNCYIKEGEEITGLSIFNCGLNNFPQEILRLKFLKNLAIRRNKLEYLPKEIGFLSNLEYLDLRLNDIETLPNAIGLLLKLKNLNVSSNNLRILPETIGELLMLKELNLSNNKLRDIPDCIENISCLETLNLKANFWIQIPESLEKLKDKGLQIIL